MNFYDIKRAHFYENQCLKAEDLQTEQDYHLMMRRLHLAADHTFGIVWGLEIVRNPKSGECHITPGLAIDGFGHEIVVSHPVRLQLDELTQNKYSYKNKQGKTVWATNVWISHYATECSLVDRLWNVCIEDRNLDRVREKFQLAYGILPNFNPDVDSDEMPEFEVPQPIKIDAEESIGDLFPIYIGTVHWENYDDRGLPKIFDVTGPLRWYSGSLTSNLIAPAGQLWVWSQLTINPLNIINGKTGGLPTGLTFGFASGEGIASERDEKKNTQNPLGLDFYTGHTSRLSIQQNGDVGIGTRTPLTKLHVQGDREISDAKHPQDHIAIIENIASSDDADILALKIGRDKPDRGNNFITFFGADSPSGCIEGNNSGGVAFETSGADYAEYLPLLSRHKPLKSADVIAIQKGQATNCTEAAQHLTVVTDNPAVIGNHPQGELENRGVNASFIGQVKVRVKGPVQAGDYIVPSGLNDGVGQAISAEDVVLASEHTQFVGKAWESKTEEEEKPVNTAVGLPSSWPIAEIMTLLRQQQLEIQALRTEVEDLRSKLNQILLNSEIA
jgi:hypothetical protein